MLRMMKYEFRKSRFSYAILLAILGIVEVLFLGLNKFNVQYAIIPIILLIVMGIVADVWIMLSGVRMFSRDLKEKSGYMVYMTPVPIWQIVLSKVLDIAIAKYTIPRKQKRLHRRLPKSLHKAISVSVPT